jgi:hypothetical protein
LLDKVRCEVETAEQLDAFIRNEILPIEMARGEPLCGTLHVRAPHESVLEAHLVRELEDRGVIIKWVDNSKS